MEAKNYRNHRNRGGKTKRKTISNNLKSEEKLRTFQAELQSEDYMKKRYIIRRSDFPDVDKPIFVWFVQKKSSGDAVSGNELMTKALAIYRKLYPEDRACENFKAGSGWQNGISTWLAHNFANR